MNVKRVAPSDSLRAAILSDGRPMRRIAEGASVPPSTISRFIRRRRGLTSQVFDRVAAAVNCELRPVAPTA
jgi:plasmid maintenance system antidote protein VapI